MSLPLKDFRLGITESIDIWLEAEATAFHSDKAAIAREILQDWAKRKAHAFKIAQRRMTANGLQPELPGFSTEDDGADAGATGKGGRK
jgi:hypothetical protein